MQGFLIEKLHCISMDIASRLCCVVQRHWSHMNGFRRGADDLKRFFPSRAKAHELAARWGCSAVRGPITNQVGQRFCAAGRIPRKIATRHATLLGGTAIAALATILLVPALAQRSATPGAPAAGMASTAFNPATLPEQQIGE